MNKYCITDLLLSKRENIQSDSAIVIIFNGNNSYMNYFINSIRSICALCDATIILVKPNNLKIKDIVKNYNNKIYTVDLNSTIPSDLSRNSQAFQFLKPYAIQYIYKNRRKFNVKQILYLDVDIMLLRNLKELFDSIKNKPLIIKELGVDTKKFGYNNYINDPILDTIFKIPDKHKIKYPDIHCNTGVLGFDFTRSIDRNIINKWAYYTTQILEKNIAYCVKWWDQGVFNLVLEKLNVFNLASDYRKFNYTVLPDNYYNFDISFSDANIVHFIGDSKPALRKTLFYKKVLNTVDIALCGHTDQTKNNYQQRKYIQHYNLNNLQYKNSHWSHNTIGESRIFLADDIFDDNKQVWGCLTASFNEKYNPFKIDQLNNYIDFDVLHKSHNLVYCTSICAGNAAGLKQDMWHKNFQKHFRNLYKNSYFVQENINKITGLEYDETTKCPYANQIICNKELMQELIDYMRSVIDKVLDTFGLDFQYPNAPDPRRNIAYIMEEISMLWWANKKNIKYLSFCQPSRHWYENRQYLNT